MTHEEAVEYAVRDGLARLTYSTNTHAERREEELDMAGDIRRGIDIYLGALAKGHVQCRTFQCQEKLPFPGTCPLRTRVDELQERLNQSSSLLDRRND